MRHGVKTGDPIKDTPPKDTQFLNSTKIPSNLLGCYFCNDIVAPGNVFFNLLLNIVIKQNNNISKFKEHFRSNFRSTMHC